MQKADREARLQRAKTIGRIAYRLARAEKIEGVIELDGEEKHLREFSVGGLFIKLHEPFRSHALPTEFGRLQIRNWGAKVFEIRWTKAGVFKIVAFEPGEWEAALPRRARSERLFPKKLTLS